MATSAVDRAAMAMAAQEIEAKAQVIQGLRNTLEDHKATIRAGWKGTAAGTFDHVFGEFDADFTKVIQALETMHERLTHTRIQYEAREQESHAAVSEVQRLLGGG
jgi:WXG100 family type VII secretion target